MDDSNEVLTKTNDLKTWQRMTKRTEIHKEQKLYTNLVNKKYYIKRFN